MGFFVVEGVMSHISKAVDAERYSSNYQTGGIINTASHIKQK
jgi:hypothetical protein